MIVRAIYTSKRFIKEFERPPQPIQLLAAKKEVLFHNNPLHPSLRLHQLHGKFIGVWSITITAQYRIIFKHLDNGDILFVSIGTHDVYRSL